ncbi:hypothetical protein FOA52_008456 [Chlamydomonas sp. UWO 241]|nr:hypothetical protein FOA52_008456 [Chlamydomonas sp. UWO 241]
MQNAPRKVFELIGDPRSGVADDVRANAFGEITVDMLHHQLSNEVYWYKYEFAGNALAETHRDARLSEHTKNLMYILRAKDPARWTVEALARKFHVRRQRVLAILALKEMEAHRMEVGSTLGGPLSGYACPVHLADVTLDKSSGEPAAQLRDASAGVQRALLTELQPHGFSAQALAAALESQVGVIEAQLAALEAAAAAAAAPPPPAAGEEAGTSGGDDAAAGAAAAGPLSARVADVRDAVARLMEAAGKLLGASDVLAEEAALASASAALRRLLPIRFDAGTDGDVDVDASALSAVLNGWAGHRLLRLVLALAPPQRAALLSAHPPSSIKLTALGTDIGALTSRSDYRGPASHAVPDSPEASVSDVSSSGSQSTVDVLGHRPVSDANAEAVAAALSALERTVAGLRGGGGDGGSGASGGSGAGSGSGDGLLEAGDVRAAIALRRTYMSTDQMLGQLVDAQRGSNKRRHALWRVAMLAVLDEANPAYPERCLKYDKVIGLIERGDTQLALVGLAELEGSEERARAVLAAMAPEAAEPNAPLDPLSKLRPGEAVAPRRSDNLRAGSWDLVAAYLDTRVAQKVYHRGSGERHVVRLPSYPAFEGYTLNQLDAADEGERQLDSVQPRGLHVYQPSHAHARTHTLNQLDAADEGELSSLNRVVAAREDERLASAFAANLVFNLGMEGPDLWDTSRPQPAPNITSSLDAPLVVYDIGPDGNTLYPPVKVVQPDGSTRPLDAQEKVFQSRRRPPAAVAYQLQRVRRKPELS